jgi:quinohemoprotein ethanol dehydrogenase
MIFIGPVGSEYGVRGFMAAYSAKTGELLWKHYNIPSPGEYGHNTWPTGTTCVQCNGEWEHGGATVWQAPRVDPKAGLIYYSTANAGPDYTGDARAGANLWTAATLALSYKTGEIAWGYQEVHHDIWDFDSAAPVSVVDVEVNGKMVEGVVETNKDGDTYFENATTGEPVFPTKEESYTQDEAEETFPTEPIPTFPNVLDGEKIPASVLAELQAGVNSTAAAKHITPVPMVEEAGIAGDQFGKIGQPGETTIQALERSGPQFQDGSYDPTNGYYYVCGRVTWQVYQSPNEFQKFEEGKGFSGITSISVAAPPVNMGFLDAYNMHTGQLAWHLHWPTACASGTTTTAGNVLFVGKSEGELIAYNATTGEELWKFGTGAGANAAVAVYEYAGKERVAIYSGGNESQSKQTAEHGDNLWQFSLEGTKSQIGLGEAGEPPTTLPGGETR